MDLDSEDSDSRTAVLGHKRKLPGLFLNDADATSNSIFNKRPKVYENGDHVPFSPEQGDYDGSRRSSKESGEMPTNSAGVALDVGSKTHSALNRKKPAAAHRDQDHEDTIVLKRMKELANQDITRKPSEKKISQVDEKLHVDQPLHFEDYKSISEWLTKNGFSIRDNVVQHSGLKASVKQCRGSKNGVPLPEILLKLSSPGCDYSEQAQACLIEQYRKFRSRMADLADDLRMNDSSSLATDVDQYPMPTKHSKSAMSVLERDDTFACLGGTTMQLSDIPNVALQNHVQTLSQSMPGRSLEEILLGVIKCGGAYASLATKPLGHWLRLHTKHVQKKACNAVIPHLSLDELDSMLSQPDLFLRPLHIGDVAAGNAQLLSATIQNIKFWECSSWSEALLRMAKGQKFNVQARRALTEYMMRFYTGAERDDAENGLYSDQAKRTVVENFKVDDASLEAEVDEIAPESYIKSDALSFYEAEKMLLQQPYMFKRPMTKQDFLAHSTFRRMELQAQAESFREQMECSWEKVALFMAHPTGMGRNGENSAVRSSISSYIARCYLGQRDTHLTAAEATIQDPMAALQIGEPMLPLRQSSRSESLSLHEIADFLALHGCFSRQITLDDVAASDHVQLFQYLCSLSSKRPTASIASLLVGIAEGDWQANEAGSFLYRWLKNYYTGTKKGVLKKRRASALRLLQQHNAAAQPPIPAPGDKRWLFIGPFKTSASEKEVRELLRDYRVDQSTIPANKKGVLKRHAFVTMMSNSDAERAIRDLEDTSIRGKKLKVRYAETHPRPSWRDLDHLKRLYQEAKTREAYTCPTAMVGTDISPSNEIERSPGGDTLSGNDAASETDNNDGESGVSVQVNLSMASIDYDSTAQAVTTTSRPAASSTGELVLLRDLSKNEQDLQRRYFQINGLDAAVHCLSCGVKGHMEDSCPSRTCSHCNALDEHFSNACPAFRKCGRCRQRGHETGQCTNPSARGGGPADPCDVCGKHDHVEEECPGLWRSFALDESNLKKIPASAMIRSCYNCGSKQHWGDDCNRSTWLERRRLHAVGSNSIWSAEHANKFIEGAELPLSANGTRSGRTPNYQLAMLDDMRD